MPETEERVHDDDLGVDCICDFPLESCGGLGVIYCEGCGGDLCVCICGGEIECSGCAECAGDADDYD